MDYTLTRIDPNGENDRYPCRNRRSLPILWSRKSIKACIWGNSNTRCMTW
nr:NADH-quinone oxidoreductase subunit B [Klebsiella pneumoniae]